MKSEYLYTFDSKKKHRFSLNLQIFIAIILGVAYGIFIPELLDYVDWMGDLYIRILKLVTVPLICTTIIAGMSQILNSENFNRIGIKVLLYYAVTSFLAVVLGLALVNIINPGYFASTNITQNMEGISPLKDSYLNAFKIIPNNIFESLVNGNLMPIIFFSMLFGYFTSKVGESHKRVLVDFFTASSEVLFRIVKYLIRVAPFGILGLMAKISAENFGEYSKLIDSLIKLKMYFFTILLAFIIHGIIVIPLLLKFIGKTNPWLHFKAMFGVLSTAFATSSSEATLPLTMLSTKSKTGVSNRIASIVLPFGSSINMNGTVLYQCIAALFIAQAYGIELNLYEQGLIMITAMLASLGSAGIPMSNIAIISVILATVGLPLEGIGLIFIADKIIDMFRTALNVWSDTCAATIIARTEGEMLNY